MPARREPLSKIRSALWPIYNDELKKFLPMTAIMFLVLFSYTIVRILKDTLIATAPGSGAEVFSFLKGWVVLPASFLFILIYTKMSSSLSKKGLYYATLVPFIVFFCVFALFIYPYAHLLHPSLETVQGLQEAYPNFRWLFPIYGVWTYSLFYTFSELWGSIGTAIIFWQFANEVTQTQEAKRYYSFFGFFANFSLIAAGYAVQHATFQALIWLVVLSFFAILAAYSWIHAYVVPGSIVKEKGVEKKKKPKLSMGESFKLLIQSRYLGYIAILVLAYGMTINMVEVTWKSMVREAYPNPKDYQNFMGAFFNALGVVTIVLLFTTKGLVRRFGWLKGAIATPMIILITGTLFFLFILFDSHLSGVVAYLGTTPLMLAVLVGAVQNVLSKGVKYSLFDPTKEMTYIPLDDELKVKGKAAVDVIGNRMGKSGGGYIQQVLLIATAGTQITIAPYLACVLGLVILAWIWAVKGLSFEYGALVKKRQQEEEGHEQNPSPSEPKSQAV